MLTMLKESHPIAKKEHICEFCGGKINKGQKYCRQTNIYDGYIYDWIEHEECYQIASELDMSGECDFDEGWAVQLFSHIIEGELHYPYYCINNSYKYCIPYNEDTKHIVDTSDVCPEYYKWWEK